jgi:hypothetical protein
MMTSSLIAKDVTSHMIDKDMCLPNKFGFDAVTKPRLCKLNGMSRGRSFSPVLTRTAHCRRVARQSGDL